MNQVPSSDSPPPEKLRHLIMRRLIRSKATNTFLTTTGDWTPDLARAKAFADRYSVVMAKRHRFLQEVEAYYSFDLHRRSFWDFALPL
jgi:hypothetical protein